METKSPQQSWSVCETHQYSLKDKWSTHCHLFHSWVILNDSFVDSMFVLWSRSYKFKTRSHDLKNYFLLLNDYIPVARDFYISLHCSSLSLSNWSELNFCHTSHDNAVYFPDLPWHCWHSPTATSRVQLWLRLPVCDWSISVIVIANKFVELKRLIETKIQILYNHADHIHFHTAENGWQIIQLLTASAVESRILPEPDMKCFFITNLAGKPLVNILLDEDQFILDKESISLSLTIKACFITIKSV